jgi:hypothetical protein
MTANMTAKTTNGFLIVCVPHVFGGLRSLRGVSDLAAWASIAGALHVSDLAAGTAIPGGPDADRDRRTSDARVGGHADRARRPDYECQDQPDQNNCEPGYRPNRSVANRRLELHLLRPPVIDCRRQSAT